MIDMTKKDILPAVASYIKDLAKTSALAKDCGADTGFEDDLVKRLSSLASQTYKKLTALEEAETGARDLDDVEELSRYYHDSVFVAMGELRAVADEIETLVGEKYWPYPTYGQLLFYVK